MKAGHSIQIHETTQLKSNGTLLYLTYFLTKRISEESAQPLCGISVRIRKEGEEHYEEVQTPPISHSETFVRQLLNQLIKGKVTPMCLLEVLDEMISLEELQTN